MNAVEEKAQGFRFSQSEIDDILVECYKRTDLFAKIFFPERFHLPFSQGHKEMFELIDTSDTQLINIIANRGVGKSTIFNLVVPAKHLCYRDKNFISQISNTADQALRDSEDLKNELLTNQNILAVFGSLKPETREIQFAKTAWKTAPEWEDGEIKHQGTLVLPRGWGQQVRGIKNGRFRYDCIIADDIEGTEGVMADDQRRKLKRWFFADVLNSVQRAELLSEGEHRWRVIVIGTLLHEDSLLANLAELDTWTTVRISLCDIDDDGKNIKSNWEEFLSTPSVIKLYEQYEAANELDSFHREYLGQPVSAKTRKFQSRFFRYYEEADLVGKTTLESVVIVDPAKTTEEHSADTAIVGWSFDANSGYLYLRDVDAGKIHVDDMYRRSAEMAVRIGARVIGVESTGIGEFIVHPFKTFISRWGYNLEFVELKSKGQKGEKDNRIASLLPYYRQGRILHNRTCSKGLEIQLLSFPFSKRKDISDAAAYITEMLSLGDRFFTPEHIANKKTLNEKFAALRESQPKPVRAYAEPSMLNPTRRSPQSSPVSPRLHKWETNRFEQLFGVTQCQS